MNLRGMKKSADGMKPKLDKMIQSVTNGKVQIKESNDEFKSTYEIIKDLSREWGKLDSQKKAMLGEQIAGKNQVTKCFVRREICVTCQI